jgi:putative oxidoreductase
MTAFEMNAAPRWRQISLWAVKALLAVAFLGAGGAKLFGVPMMVEIFKQVGVGQWFRYLIGSLELIGAAAVLIPATAGFGGALLACIMIGAILT